MRLRPSICAFVVMCWALTYSYVVDAQEGKSTPEIDVPSGIKSDPDPVLGDPESKTSKFTAPAVKEAPRDSIQIKPVKPFKPAEKAEKEEDPLSFNFLYYIIEKFKMSDIIE